MEALFVWLISVWDSLKPLVIVDPWEAGIRVRGGKKIKKIGPGIHRRFPVLDDFFVINVRRQVIDLDDQTVETSDRIPMLLSLTVGYSIKHPDKIWLKVQDHDESLQTDIQKVVADWVNITIYSDLTIVNLVDSCFADVRSIGFNWGCEIDELGVNTISKHRPYRFIMS